MISSHVTYYNPTVVTRRKQKIRLTLEFLLMKSLKLSSFASTGLVMMWSKYTQSAGMGGAFDVSASHVTFCVFL